LGGTRLTTGSEENEVREAFSHIRIGGQTVGPNVKFSIEHQK